MTFCHFVQPIFDHYTHLDLCRRYFVVDPRNRMLVGNLTRNHNWIQPIVGLQPTCSINSSYQLLFLIQDLVGGFNPSEKY